MFGFWYLYIGYAFILTYLIIGLVVSFETTAAMSGGKFAVKWIREHFSYYEYYYAVIVFYPLLWISYFFLEVVPSFITHEIRCVFSLEALFNDLFPSK